MSARASRRAAHFDFSSLSNIECLLIAQAVHEYGTVWSSISKLMAKHALVSRPKNFFTPTLCSSIYEHLIQDAGLERTEAAAAPKAPENLALAQKRFQIRFEELVGLIKAEESKFKTVMKEIEEIKAGHWDSGLKARLSGTPAAAVERDTTEDAPEATEDDADADATSEPEENVEESGEPEEEDAMDDEASQPAEEEAKSDDEDEEADAGTEEPEEPLEDNSEVNESANEADETSKEAEGEADKQGESSEDEPLQVVRRSTRRKSSAASTAPPAPSRGRRRQRALKEEQESAAESGAEAEASEDAGQEEEEAPSSPGEPRTRDGKRKAAFSDDARDSKRPREDSEIPEEEEEPTTTTRASGRKGSQKVIGPSPSASTSAGPAPAPASTTATEGLPNKKFQNVIGLLHQQISTHRNGTIFHHPIKTGDAPDYYDIVKRPMDLKTIKQRVKDGAISNSLEYQRDVYLMFANAMMYNRPGSDVYTMAEDMMHDSELAIKNYKQTEGFRAQRS